MSKDKNSFEKVKKLFQKHGLTLISSVYENATTELEYICTCGNKSSITFNILQGNDKRRNSKIGCKKCRGQRISETNKGVPRPLMRGENNPNYNPNKTSEQRIIERSSYLNTNWRKSVFIRDDYTCQSCNKRDGSFLVAHHLNSYHWDIDGRYDVNNGITLCEKCHKNFHHIYGNKNNTNKQFHEFLQGVLQ